MTTPKDTTPGRHRHEAALDPHHENAMTMLRPWDKANPGDIWVINGKRPSDGMTFDNCLAVVLPQYVTGPDVVLFKFIGALDDVIAPHWITSARALLLVERDDPRTAYYLDDQEYIQ